MAKDRKIYTDLNSEWIAALDNRYADAEYLKIYTGSGSDANGGEQGWWAELGYARWKYEIFDSLAGKAYRLHYRGCGVIAMCDMELYMAQQNPGYQPTCAKDTAVYDSNTGILQKKDYMSYVEKAFASTYRILHIPIIQVKDIPLGLLPDKMIVGLKAFLKKNNSPFHSVQWAPYFLRRKQNQKPAVLDKIKDMLHNNIPVVFSYYRNDGKEIFMYYNLEDARHRKGKEDAFGSGICGHYMTIIGLYRYQEDSPESGLHYEYIMKVVTWGQVRYIRYDEYADNLSLFTNILAVC